MRVAFIGLGRLGLPIAAVLSQSHLVTGYDPDPSTASRLKVGHDWEDGLGEFLNDQIALTTSIDAACYDADVAVVCVQTPHHPDLDGTHDTSERAPFDLSYVSAALDEIPDEVPVVLMSTVLPGDCRSFNRENLIYMPAFPAMGTTISDFLNPEFVLVGGASSPIPTDVFGHLWPSQTWHFVDWETAELTKMAYNTAIGMKIAVANTVGWLGEYVGADGGKVMEILSQATRRIVSPSYMKPGLGDGGACHPRDQIALSWLAQVYDVYDLFGAMIDQRSAHSEWVAKVANDNNRFGRPPVILGAAYKADSTLVDGSPARLLANQTGWEIVERPPTKPSVVIIGVPHSRYESMDMSEHVVIDPWGLVDGAIQPGR